MGGPADQIPPRIEQFMPSHRAIKVPPGSVLSFTWSEWLNRQSLEKGLLVNPPNVGRPHFRWSGRKVSITFDSSFALNTTYSITISSATSDLHGVKLGTPILYSFTTGDSLAAGIIAGRIIGPVRAPLVCAYVMSGADSPFAPDSQRADYITTTAEDGRFQFSFLNPGRYRILAFEDENGNKLPDVARERIALASCDYAAGNDSMAGPLLSLARMDTLGFALVSARSLGADLVRLQFNRPVRSAGGKGTDLVRIISGDSLRDTLGVLHSGLADLDSEWVFKTAPQKRPLYRIQSIGFVDAMGRRPSRDTAVFTPVAQRDTLPPRIARTEPPRGILMPGDSLELVFSKPVLVHPTRFRVLDSSRIQLPVRVRAKGLMRAIANLDSVQPGRSYVLQLQPYAISDLERNMLRDTMTQRFSILGEEDLTKGITGRILSEDPSPTVVVWSQLDTQRKLEFVFNSDSIQIAGLPAGRYQVFAFKDQNRNGRYDPGALKPFVFSELQTVIPDTLTLRARWEFEGITLEFEK